MNVLAAAGPTALGAFIVSAIVAIGAATYGEWWLAALFAIAALFAGASVFRSARKIYKAGSWQPS